MTTELEYNTKMKDRHGNTLACIDFPGIMCDMSGEQIENMIAQLSEIKNEVDAINATAEIGR